MDTGLPVALASLAFSMRTGVPVVCLFCMEDKSRCGSHILAIGCGSCVSGKGKGRFGPIQRLICGSTPPVNMGGGEGWG
jgi:hypothetical protein